MPRVIYRFPSTFHWGVGVRSFQVWGPAPQSAGADRIHEAPVLAWQGKDWRQDLRFAAQMNLQVLGLYLSWPRLQPSPDAWDRAWLDRYRDILAYARELGLEVWLAFHDGEEPAWFHEREGWLHREAPRWFAGYVTRVARELAPWVTAGWCPLPEPNRVAWEGYITGERPPGFRVRWPQALVALGHMMEAHARVAAALRRLAPRVPVFLSLAVYPALQPARRWHPADRRAVAQARHLLLQTPARSLAGPLHSQVDKIGVVPMPPKVLRVRRPGLILQQASFSSSAPPTHPRQGTLFQALKGARRLARPLWILHHSGPDVEDTPSPGWLVDQLLQVWHGLIYGAVTQAYLYEGLVDGPDFRGKGTCRGLLEVDRVTRSRRERAFARFYREVIREGGLSHNAVAAHAPERLSLLYPGFPLAKHVE